MDIDPFQPVDRISNLPDHVMDDILMRLTTRDAAKTSVLAKQWRHKWHNLPQLIFDNSLWPKTYKEARLKFVQILDKVLLHHQGPINKFSLDFPCCLEIDPLIHILWKKNVQELILKTGWGDYTLPSAIFSCLQLNHLSVSYCEINPPPSFYGFNRLISLELDCVTIETGVLAKLISSCPLLEQLALLLWRRLQVSAHLEIDAPNLKFFELKCGLESVCFKKSPLLAKVSLGCHEENVGYRVHNFDEFFNSVPGLQELYIDGFFFYTVPPPLKNLKTLKLSRMALYKFDNLLVVLVLFLMRSCPNLEQLKIEMYVATSISEKHINSMKASLEEQDFSNVSFHHLQEVMMSVNGNEFDGSFAEMALAKFLLEKSPVLKRMVILSSCNQFNVKLVETLKELNKFWRASPKAEVIYLNQDKL